MYYFIFHMQGVYIGWLLGFAVGLWIGIGAKVYPPPVTKPPLSTAGCTTTPTNSTIPTTTAVNTTR